ncbi:LOW QUALITY PROTEIN: transmembrane protease serine 5 [Manacus vitellinus]|uniref:LOW QUALITY PROTEIN: transmembrane protease serine 5 n=1 Tax=Manacus vitellinus TaxID=328815 RepID=UPI000DF0E2A2|nr:LOW QUALITY PROTEIN: transmembrane protease serine 5 [Manacus vitellinus]
MAQAAAKPRSPDSPERVPDNPNGIEDAVHSPGSPAAEPRRGTQPSLGHVDPAEASFGTLCTLRRLFLLLGVVGLLAGTAAGTWLLGQINTANSLLEAQLEGHPGWLLVCHEGWNGSLGTLLCQQLGYLRMTHQKGVNLTDVRVNEEQQFLQVRPHQEGSLEDLWQVRSSCGLGRVVALKCSECGLPPGAVRVVGGADVPPGRWPWQVSVCQGSQHRCGGSVLAREWIITAAHCVHRYPHAPHAHPAVPPALSARCPWVRTLCSVFCVLLSSRRLQGSAWRVFAGIVTHGSLRQEAGVPVQEVVPHPLYNHNNLDYDIALMKLQVPLNFSAAIRAVCLPSSHQDLLQGTQCWVSGWGYTTPDQAQLAGTLKEALVPLIGTRRCNSSCMYPGELTARMLCAGYPRGQVDACQGDSGGPLVCWDGSSWRLVGIVSWGQGCAEPNHPGVYTNVAQLLPWIHQVTQIY